MLIRPAGNILTALVTGIRRISVIQRAHTVGEEQVMFLSSVYCHLPMGRSRLPPTAYCRPPRSYKMPKQPLSRFLFALFLLAMIMGPGPGLRLVNPDPADPNAVYTMLGLPVIYVWGLFWYAVQLVAIIIAYRKLWTTENSDAPQHQD